MLKNVMQQAYSYLRVQQRILVRQHGPKTVCQCQAILAKTGNTAHDIFNIPTRKDQAATHQLRATRRMSGTHHTLIPIPKLSNAFWH